MHWHDSRFLHLADMISMERSHKRRASCTALPGRTNPRSWDLEQLAYWGAKHAFVDKNGRGIVIYRYLFISNGIFKKRGENWPWKVHLESSFEKTKYDFRKYFIKNQWRHFVKVAVMVWSRKGILSLEKCQNLTSKEVLISIWTETWVLGNIFFPFIWSSLSGRYCVPFLQWIPS